MNSHLALVGSLAISAALVGCATSVPRSTPTPRATLNAPLPADTGAIVGWIDRCFALAAPMSGPLTRSAGTVDVFGGEPLTTSQPPVAVAQVAAGGEYAFTLPPGTYVLVAHPVGTPASSPITVTVASGRTTTQHLGYDGCK